MLNRPHDVGGRHVGQPIPGRGQSATFETAWHARVLAVTVAAGALGEWTLDESRHARESVAARGSRPLPYFELWMAALIDLLIAKGLVHDGDLSRPAPAKPVAPHPNCLVAGRVDDVLARGNPTCRDSVRPPKFSVGDKVQAQRPATVGADDHSRLPTYATARHGRIMRCHGTHILPDSSARGDRHHAEPLYSVLFCSHELWSDGSDDEVVIDIWESYLSPA